MGNYDVLDNVRAGAGLEALDGIEILHRNGRSIVTRVGLRVSLKFQNGHTIEKREAALRVMQSFYETFKENLTHWLPTTGGGKKAVSKDQMPPLEQREALDYTGEWYGSKLFGYRSGQTTKEPALLMAGIECVWDKQPEKNSLFEANIPLSWAVANGFDRVRELVRSWSAQLSAVHGTTGISLLFNDGDGSSYLEYSYFLLKKFPGLDYENNATFSVEVNWQEAKPFKIRTISWLTILGETIIAELGGREKMRAELGQNCPMFDYDGGTIIQAMPVPELGSSEDGIWPDGYKKVAKLTKPVLFDAYSGSLFKNLPSPLDDREETLQWLRRFD